MFDDEVDGEITQARGQPVSSIRWMFSMGGGSYGASSSLSAVSW